MRYIRTKDGIYKGNEDWYRQCYCFESIIKQADTIEELCDEFVIDNPKSWEHKPFISQINCNAFLNGQNAKYQKENNIKTYGAIWTDRGLIYVAKLNEEGAFELL